MEFLLIFEMSQKNIISFWPFGIAVAIDVSVDPAMLQA